jgi:hypothetical protein
MSLVQVRLSAISRQPSARKVHVSNRGHEDTGAEAAENGGFEGFYWRCGVEFDVSMICDPVWMRGSGSQNALRYGRRASLRVAAKRK